MRHAGSLLRQDTFKGRLTFRERKLQELYREREAHCRSKSERRQFCRLPQQPHSFDSTVLQQCPNKIQILHTSRDLRPHKPCESVTNRLSIQWSKHPCRCWQTCQINRAHPRRQPVSWWPSWLHRQSQEPQYLASWEQSNDLNRIQADYLAEEAGSTCPQLQQAIRSHSQVVGRHNFDRGAIWWAQFTRQPIHRIHSGGVVQHQAQVVDSRAQQEQAQRTNSRSHRQLRAAADSFRRRQQIVWSTSTWTWKAEKISRAVRCKQPAGRPPPKGARRPPRLQPDGYRPQQNHWPDSFKLRSFQPRYPWSHRLHQQHAHRYIKLWTHPDFPNFQLQDFSGPFRRISLMLNTIWQIGLQHHNAPCTHNFVTVTVLAAGPIPLAMQNLPVKDFRPGNPGLCGTPLPNKCK